MRVSVYGRVLPPSRGDICVDTPTRPLVHQDYHVTGQLTRSISLECEALEARAQFLLVTYCRSCTRLESPTGSGLPQRGASQASSLTPRNRPCRTSVGIRRNCNIGFKSPVQSLNLSRPPGAHEDTLEREISELKQKEASLDKDIAQLEAEGYHLAELDKHISLLHQYNELKDTGQMLLGRLAFLRGVTTKDLYAEFGMDLDD
ncbi:DNA repair protein SWI5 homolog [Pseudophryne corroboree]|uniref:DNA repair protein SWI5 homolog n=1 Tax=Pseudophryne corroboree TaxID=495146 RepID=UPI003081B462